MFTLLALGVIGFMAAAVLGLLAAVASLVCWVLFLPFRLLSLVFRGFAALLALPFLLLFALLGVVLFAAGMIVFLVPLLPFALLIAAIWWLMTRRDRAHPAGA